MKKTLIALSTTAILVVSSSAMALGNSNSNLGCGLGSVIMKNQSSNFISQIIAATINGTSGTQTFGITSGTVGCARPTKLVMNDKAKSFVASNMDSIAIDVAAGKGESLDTLLSLINVADKKVVATTLKSNFSNIFTSASVTSGQVVDNIITVL